MKHTSGLNDGANLFRGGLVWLLAIVLLALTPLYAVAATVTIRPDAVITATSWTGATAANLSDVSDGTAASTTATNTLQVTLGNNAAYAGATISDATLYVRASSVGSGGPERLNFGDGTTTASNISVTRGAFSDLSITLGALTPAQVDALNVYVTSGSAGETIDVADIWVVVTYTGATSPTLTTPTATLVGSTTATLGATVTSDGGASLTARGTCWGLSAAPAVNCVAEGGTAVSAFTHSRTGLDEGSLIYYRGYAANSAGTGYSPDGTTYTEPTQPHTLTFSGTGQTGMTVGWTVGSTGNADNVIVVMRQGAAPSADPADSTTYTANAAFGSGTALGGGFVVYKGTGSSVTVSGLTENTAYYVNVYAFAAGAGGTENYNVTSPLAGNQSTLPAGPVCTPAAMSISAAPATKNVRPGFAITYNITVVNNDSAECSDLTVNLGVGDNPVTPTANFAVSTLSVPSLVVAPQSSGAATLTVTAQPAGAETSTLTTTVTATAAGHAAQNDSVVSTILDYNPLIHSSRSTNSTKWGGNWGVAGGQYGEITCATCHTNGATPNIKRIRNTLSATFGSRAVSLTTTDEETNITGNGFGDDSDARGATESNRICEACHTITNVHRVTTTSTPDLTHYNNKDCVTCHQHNKGFDASCTTCHGNPPVDSGTLVQPSSRPTGSLTAGAHGAHNTLGIACARCHYNSVGSGATHDVDGQVSLGFVNLPTGTGGVSAGTYNGQTTVTYNWTDAGSSGTNNGNKTCANYCHGSAIGGTGAVWDVPGSGTCGNCHGAAAATPPTRVNHPRHAGTAAGQLGLTCDKCHGASYAGGSAPANHMNGSVTYDVSGLTGATPTYRGNSGAQSTGTIAPSGTYGNCGNTYCHSNVQSSNGTAAASVYATPTWGAASVTCDSCHGSGAGNGRPNTGNHLIHVTTRGYACSVCHSGAGDETAVHANGTINIAISATYGGTYSQGSHAPGTGGYGTCSNVNCHNMKATVAWGTTGTTCTLCHTVDGANSATVANPVSGLHSNAVASVQDHDSTLAGGCEACHVKASITGHWDGVASATADYTKAAVGITATWYTDAGGTAATRGSCMSNTALATCHSDGGDWRRQWSTNADVDIVASPNPGQAVCNVCHGQLSTLTNSTGWNEGTSHYRSGIGATEDKGFTAHTDPSPNQCEDCHGYDSAATHNSNNKIDFSGSGVTFTLESGTSGWYCDSCHFNRAAEDATSTSTHTFLDSLAFPGIGNIVYVAGTSVPEGSCFGCHGDGAAEYWPQNAGNVRGSTTMSDYNNAGEHQKHMEVLAARLGYTLPGDDAQQRAMCAYCHVVEDVGHMTIGLSEIAETFPVGGKKSLWNATDSDATFNTTTYNCTTVDCHNSKDTTAAYSWYGTGTSTCTMCHTVGGTNSATVAHPASGIHDVARITGKLHDDSYTYNTSYASTADCVYCHTSTPTTSSGHINGVNDYSIGVNDVTGARVNLAAAVGFTDATSPAFPTCAPTLGTGCHFEQWAAATDHTWTRTWHESAGNNNGTECQGCHGTFTQSWRTGVSPSHTNNYDGNNGEEIRLNHDHGAASETEYNQCISCHVYNDAGYGALGWNLTAANKHGNGQIEMITAMDYATASNTCATTCHDATGGSHAMTPDSGWGVVNLAGPALSCTICHSSIYNGGAGTHIDADGAAATYNSSQCEACHGTAVNGHADGSTGVNDIEVSTVYTGTTAVPTMTLADGTTALYATHNYKIRLGGTATIGSCNTKSTEAEWCWACHDALATKVTEWRTNTQSATGSSTFDYGRLYTDASTVPGTETSNWTTGYWRSGKGLNNTLTTNPFWYKRGKIRSTHSANYDGTTATSDSTKTWKGSLTNTASGYSTTYNKNENLDAVGSIRCTYCHDVHGTHDGIKGDVAGKPFLRGTWIGSLYPEDGAPRYGMTTFTDQNTGTATIAYGAVPRGSADPNNTGLSGVAKVGGFWIDQNSNNPTASITGATALDKASNSSGLCEQCHGANKNGTWTAAAIGSLDQITGEALWVSGGNGHANSVIGAAGVTTTAANIFNRTRRGSSGITGSSFSNNGTFNGAVDMGLATMTSYGVSYRQSTSETTGLRWKPWVANSTETGTTVSRSYAYRSFAWNQTSYQTSTRNFSIASGTSILYVTNEPELTTETAHNSQANYHTFTCSKCHNPHASRLPKLMITNCLDTNHNTWEDKNTFTQGQATMVSPWTGLRHSQWPSAQNCHRLDARATNAGTTTVGTGWTTVTPWIEDTAPNPASGSGKTADLTTLPAY